MDNLTRAVIYLVDTLVHLYVVIILLRVLLQWVRADFYNPVCQFLVKLTQPVLRPLRRLIPSIGPIDTAAWLLMLGLEVGLIAFKSALAGLGVSPAFIVLSAAQTLLMALLTTYILLIIALVILSWVGNRWRHPVVPLVYQLTEPVLRPIRRLLPPIAGFDLSPIVALVGIRFLMVLLGW